MHVSPVVMQRDSMSLTQAQALPESNDPSVCLESTAYKCMNLSKLFKLQQMSIECVQK